MSRSRGVVNDLPARNRLAMTAHIKNARIIFPLCPVRKLAGYPREIKEREVIMYKLTLKMWLQGLLLFSAVYFLLAGAIILGG